VYVFELCIVVVVAWSVGWWRWGEWREGTWFTQWQFSCDIPCSNEPFAPFVTPEPGISEQSRPSLTF